jgi:formylglycine-generating enzyme required for sulfatase activity
VWLDGGTFQMGAQAEDQAAPNYDSDAAPWEGPVASRAISPFAFRRFPTTVDEFNHFVSSGGYRQAQYWTNEAWDWRVAGALVAPLDWEEQLLVPNAPVTGVSWYEAVAYCTWLTMTLENGRVHRLPSEVEWEYAARRGVSLPGRQFPWGNRMRGGEAAEANWAGASLRRKTPVGMFPPSTTKPDRIADLYGNVEEWCLDAWDPATDEALARGDPPSHFLAEHSTLLAAVAMPGPRQSSIKRVVRGGSCIRFSRLCRPSYRSRIGQDGRYHTVGFRPAVQPTTTM